MQLRSIDLNLLLVFDALIQERHVSRAAMKLGRTQSAVSHSLKKLRETFNDELFVRKERDMVPTPRASELAESITHALADIQAAVNRFEFFDPKQSSRHFRLAMSDALASMFLPDLIARFQTLAPQVTVSVSNISAEVGYERLHNGRLDSFILGNAPPIPQSLLSETLLTEKFLCALSTCNPIANKPLTLESYLSCPHVQVSLDGISLGVADIVLQGRGMTRNVTTIVPNYLVVPGLIKNTNLIATFGEAPLMAIANSDSIALAKPPIELPDIVYSMIYDQRVQSDPEHIWLRSILIEIADAISLEKQQLYGLNKQLF